METHPSQRSKNKPRTLSQSRVALLSPIERLPPEIALQILDQITQVSRILFGLSSPFLYKSVSLELFRKIHVWPRINRTNYLEYLNFLRRLWGSYTRRNGSWAQIIIKEIRVLSLRCRDTEGDNDMRSFVRLHTWIEQSMLMDEITTDFVVFSLRKQCPAIPFQTWCARSSLGRSGVRNQYYVHERAMQTALSHNLFRCYHDSSEDLLGEMCGLHHILLSNPRKLHRGNGDGF